MDDLSHQWDAYVSTYEGLRYLEHAEQRLLRRRRLDWARLSMLDIGIGAGRTTFTFAAVAGRYVGIDVSPAMIRAARGFVAEEQHISLLVGDARKLTDLQETFDVILFSFNGIDSLEREDRLAALDQMRAVLNPDGDVLFSTHSLHGLQAWLAPRRPSPSLPSLYRWSKELPAAWRLARVGRTIDMPTLLDQGWGRLPVAWDHPTLKHGYVSIAEQRRQLAEVGLAEIEIIDKSGAVIDPDAPPSDHFLHWLCRSSP